MKPILPVEKIRASLKPLAFAVALGIGLGVGKSQAQSTLQVGGAGTIGVTTLTTTAGTAELADNGDRWSTDGGTGAPVNSKLISPAKMVPTTGNVTLTFTHRYAFEKDFDGGAIYISVNGAPSVYLTGAAFSSNGYTGIAKGTAWPGGKSVFMDKSPGFDASTLIQSVASLGSLNAGDTISIEFRGEWDEGTLEGVPAWEIGTVKLTDSTATDFLNLDFNAAGPSGFTVVNTGVVAGPWEYKTAVSRFEVNGDTNASDRYAPDIVGSVINLNNANIVVDLLTGTLNGGEVFTLFDLSGGTTLTGSIGSIALVPPGIWDTSSLATAGTITYVSVPPALTWNVTDGTWDTVNENWVGDSTLFTDNGSNVLTFNNALGGTVTVTEGMSPAKITIDSAGTYKFITGVPPTGVANSIDSGILIKNGSGTLTLGDDTLNQQFGANANIYSNNFSSVTINSGTLIYKGIAALGTGTLTLAGGTTVIQSRVEGRYNTSNEDIKNDVVLSGGLVNLPMESGDENKGIWISKTVTGPGGFNITGSSRYLGLSNAGNSFSGGITLTTTAISDPATVDFGEGYTVLGTGALTVSEAKLQNSSFRGGFTARSDLPGDVDHPNGFTNSIVTTTGKYCHLYCAIDTHKLLWGGVISGGGNIRKWKNNSTVILSGTNTYTGGTDVDAGTLLINGDSSAATGPVNVATDTGATTPSLASTLGGTGTIGGNILVGALGKLAPGVSTGTFTALGSATWTAAGGTLEIEIDDTKTPKNDKLAVTGALDITNATLNLTSTGTPAQNVYVIASYGTLTPSNGPFAAVNNLPIGYVVDYQYNGGTSIAIKKSTQTSYQLWAGGFGGLGNSDPSLDFDNGGLDTGIEWVVGGNPSNAGDDRTVAPVMDLTTDPNFLIFVYRRTNQSDADANTVITVEYGNNLTGWTTAVENNIHIFIDEFNNGFAPGVDKVEVAIHRSLAVGGKIFARLKVVVTNPAP